MWSKNLVALIVALCVSSAFATQPNSHKPCRHAVKKNELESGNFKSRDAYTVNYQAGTLVVAFTKPVTFNAVLLTSKADGDFTVVVEGKRR